MSPSLFMLGWMAAISCLLTHTGRADAAATLLSSTACLVAMVFEAGSMESKRVEKSRAGLWLQSAALAAFVLRLAVFGLRLL